MAKLVKCKTCGAEHAKNAKTCPSCGTKSKHRWGVGRIIALIILVFVAIGIFASMNKPKKVGEVPGGSATEQQAAKQTEFYVGDVVELNGIKATLVNAWESEGSTYNKPAGGKVFILCEFNIENDSSSDIAVSSMMSFEAYCDDYACPFSLSALMEKGNKEQLDATVAAGKKLNGVVGYEVPADWKVLEIRFTPDVWRGADITFIVENK